MAVHTESISMHPVGCNVGPPQKRSKRCWEITEKAVLSERLPRYYPSSYDAPRYTLHGPPARCVEQARKLVNAGVRTLIFSTVTHDHTQLERIAHEVLPELATIK